MIRWELVYFYRRQTRTRAKEKYVESFETKSKYKDEVRNADFDA